MKTDKIFLIVVSGLMALFVTVACSDSDEVYVPEPTPTVVRTILGEYPVVTQAAFDSIVVGHGWESYDFWDIDEEADTVILRDEEFYLQHLGYVPETIYDLDWLGGIPKRMFLFDPAYATYFYYGDGHYSQDGSIRKIYSYDPASNTVNMENGYLTLLTVTADTLKVIASQASRYTRKYEIFVRQSEETVQYWLDNFPLKESGE